VKITESNVAIGGYGDSKVYIFLYNRNSDSFKFLQRITLPMFSTYDFDLLDNILAIINWFGDPGSRVHIFEKNSTMGIYSEVAGFFGQGSHNIIINKEFIMTIPKIGTETTLYFEKYNGTWINYNDDSTPLLFSISYTNSTGALVGYLDDDGFLELDCFKYKPYTIVQ